MHRHSGRFYRSYFSRAWIDNPPKPSGLPSVMSERELCGGVAGAFLHGMPDGDKLTEGEGERCLSKALFVADGDRCEIGVPGMVRFGARSAEQHVEGIHREVVARGDPERVIGMEPHER